MRSSTEKNGAAWADNSQSVSEWDQHANQQVARQVHKVALLVLSIKYFH